MKKNSNLSVNPYVLDKLQEAVIRKMVYEKKYRDKDYSAKRLAKDLKSNPAYISVVMTCRFHTNYCAFVNKYRIDEAMNLLVDKRYIDVNIKDIAETAQRV